MTSKKLSLSLLTTICITAILSIRNWPLSAEYGLSSIFMIILSALVFFIPLALVCAELSSSFSEEAGIYYWVKEAFGHRIGTSAVWFSWISNVVWYPIILSFASSSLLNAFGIRADEHPYILFSVIQISFWALIYLNFKGLNFASWISSSFFWIGTVLPGSLIIILSTCYFFSGNPLHIDFNSSNLIPEFTSMGEFVFFAGLILGFAGIEMPAVHAKEVENPSKSYPKAIMYSTIVIVFTSILGTLAISMIIPQENISLVTAIFDAMNFLLDTYHLSLLKPMITLLISIGAYGGICTWISGPSKGLIEALKKTNINKNIYAKNTANVPTNILIIQGILVTGLSLLFLIMPNISSSYWVLTVLASQLYLITYFLIFFAAIYLRVKRPELQRSYKVSQGISGMFLTCFTGIVVCFFTFCMGFVPPSQIDSGDLLSYVALLSGLIFFFSLPISFLGEKKLLVKS